MIDLSVNAVTFSVRVAEDPDRPGRPDLWPGGIQEAACAHCGAPIWAIVRSPETTRVCTTCFRSESFLEAVREARA